ncbi:putative O-glycosylation ligase, exosortase A system-associated [Rhodovibrio sodomensis]|uniref:O-glycosylation ligase, exosortase A system-associated n=1 Tax=Rhodovibrio sodomensis TaxID=1088 RepID=A0ABS1DHT4_9PROT|nr:putative O-glycosylation ligase, exosortase A system-associated [Rhodovibrio sodomensis]
MVPIRDLLIAGFFAVGVVATLRRPYIGLCVWMIFTYLAPHHFTWGFAYTFSWVMIIAVVTMGSMVLNNAVRMPQPLTSTYLLGALVLWAGVTTAAAFDPQAALTAYIDALKIVTLGIVTMLLVDDTFKFRVVVSVLAGSILFFGVKGGLFVLATGGNYMVFGPPEHFMGANNGLAIALLMAMPLAWFLGTEAQNRWVRWGWFASIPFTILSILSTYSRGAVLALGCTAIYWAIASGRKKLGFGILALFPAALFLFMPDQLIERMETIENYQQDPSAMSRIEMWKFGFEIAKSHPFGGGFEVFPMYHLYDEYGVNMEYFESGKTAHSIYFEMLGQHGFVGLALFLAMGVSLFMACSRIRRRYASVTAQNFAAAAQISLVGYAVGGAFVNKAFYWPITFQLLGLVAAAATIFAHAGASADVPSGQTGRAKARPGVGRPSPARRRNPARQTTTRG